MRWRICMAVLVLATFALDCAHAPPAPPGALAAAGLDRVYRVAPYLYRSAQPSAQQLQILHAAYHVEETLKLNHAWEGREPPVLGVALVHRPWPSVGPVSAEDVAFVLDEMDACQRDHRTCLVHCQIGRDRTGLAVALWQVRAHLQSPDAAFSEWLAYGSERFYLLEETFEREVRRMGWPDWRRP